MSFKKSKTTFYLFILSFFLGNAQSLAVPVPGTSKGSQSLTVTFNFKALYDPSGAAEGLHVSYEIPAAYLADRKSLQLCLDYLLSGRNSDFPSEIIVNDENGIIQLGSQPGPNGIMFQSDRAPAGNIRVSYRILAADPKRAVGGPQTDMQRSGGGLSGAFTDILLFPELSQKFSVKMNWQLSKDNSVVTTFGEGNTLSDTKIGRDQLRNVQFVLGKPIRFNGKTPGRGFSAAGLGLSKNQVANSFEQYQGLYDCLRKSLNGSPRDDFHFFFRSFQDQNLYSGVATNIGPYGSFTLYVPQDSSLKSTLCYNLIAHEMVHVFVRLAESDWYNEGIAEYLSALVPYRAGLTSKANYLALINAAAAKYYTNSIRAVSDSAYNKSKKWSTRNSWVLSYSRGMIYFANLDAKLKKLGSKKQNTVISLILAMNNVQNLGKELTPSWKNLLRSNVGDWAVRDYEDMLDGKLIVPEPGAFGVEFQAQKISAGIFSLGFRTVVDSSGGQVISELVKGSNAANAGLLLGDTIIGDLDLLPVYSSFDHPITIKVKRNGRDMSFTYQPRADEVEAWQWKI